MLYFTNTAVVLNNVFQSVLAKQHSTCKQCASQFTNQYRCMFFTDIDILFSTTVDRENFAVKIISRSRPTAKIKHAKIKHAKNKLRGDDQ